MQRITAHADFAVDDRHRRRIRMKLAADPVWDPEHRHDRAFGERHQLRQGLEAGRDPSAFRRHKAHAVVRRHPWRQHEFDDAFGCVDPQADAPRPPTDPNRHRSAEIECCPLPADFRKLQFAARNTPRPRFVGENAANAQCPTPSPQTCES
jgi:hypothetical protein